ncbi:MAG: universal stress protein [Rhizobiaceae bacterium]
MSYKTILVCLSTEKAAEQILPIACNIARQFGAHLIGIHTLPSIMVYPGIAMHLSAPQFREFNDDMKKQNANIEAVFEKHVANETFVSEWRSLPARDRNASMQLTRSAFRSDLVIVAKADSTSERYDQSGLQEDLIMNSGRPILVIPEDYGDKSIGNEVLLAWNATRQSSSAAHQALPFLTAAKQVNILTVTQPHRASAALDTEGHELSASLAHHGMKPVVVHVEQTKNSIGEEIDHQAKINGSDLIVMGAYGHSRLHDLFFGDATRHMLNEATQPVLFSG